MKELRVICFVGFVCLASRASGQGPRTTLENKKYPVPADAPTVTLKSPAALIALAFSHDGSRIVTSSRSDVRFWDSATGREKRFLKSHGGDVVAFSRDLKRLAIARSLDVALHDAVKDQEVLNFDSKFHWDAKFSLRPMITTMAFSPDGRQLATAGGDSSKSGKAVIWQFADEP